MFPTCDVRLGDVWPRDRILRHADLSADADLGELMATVSDDSDEGKQFHHLKAD